MREDGGCCYVDEVNLVPIRAQHQNFYMTKNHYRHHLHFHKNQKRNDKAKAFWERIKKQFDDSAEVKPGTLKGSMGKSKQALVVINDLVFATNYNGKTARVISFDGDDIFTLEIYTGKHHDSLPINKRMSIHVPEKNISMVTS